MILGCGENLVSAEAASDKGLHIKNSWIFARRYVDLSLTAYNQGVWCGYRNRENEMTYATRNELDTATVATMRKLVGTKNGRKTILIHRERYQAAMSAMGFDMITTYHGFNDCLDMAELENEAAA